MPFSIEYFSSPSPVKWYWPLRVALNDKDATGIKKKMLSGGFTAKNLSEIKSLPVKNDGRQNFNLIYFDKGFADAYKKLFGSDAPRNDKKSSLVLIREKKEFFSKKAELERLRVIFRDGASDTGISGFIIFSTPHTTAKWFNNFIKELSHDNSVIDALKKTSDNAYCYIDRRLERQTRLTFVLNSIIYGLARVDNKAKLDINLKVFEHALINNKIDLKKLNKKSTPIELANQLGGAYLDFTREDQAATGMKMITSVLYKKFDTDIFHQYTGATKSKPPEKPSTGASTHEKLIIKDEEPATEATAEAVAAGEETPPPPPPGPRLLQARINDTAGRKETINYLLTDHHYKAEIFIGRPKEAFAKDETAAFPSDVIFTDKEKTEESIQVFFISNQEKNIQFTDLMLPRTGDSQPVFFGFTTGKKTGAFEAEIYAFHKNRLIQKLLLTADIKQKADNKTTSKVKLQLEFCVSKNPEGFAGRMPFELSIYYPGKNEKGTPLPAIKNGKPAGLYFTKGLSDLVTQIKEEIETAIVDIDNYPPDLTHENNRALLVSLALSGNDLFVNHLKEDIQGHLQIVSHREEFVPLDFVYTIPPPAPDATVCEHAKEALLEGKCRGCYDKTVSPAPHVCPFGFWCFSRVVERHSYKTKIEGGAGDYFIQAEPSDAKDQKLQVLKNIMYASSSKVDAAGNGLIQQVADAIKTGNTLNMAQTWAEWTSATEKNNPDTLVLIVHVEKKLKKDALEIGKDLLIKNYLDKTYIQSTQSKAPPFIIVIGCEVANVENYGFDIGSHFMNIGAAAVVSNFTKIRGRQAGPVVIKLVEFLRSKKGEDISLGEIMLKLRQYLLANGIMVGLALTAYGDADWKLNT